MTAGHDEGLLYWIQGRLIKYGPQFFQVLDDLGLLVALDRGTGRSGESGHFLCDFLVVRRGALLWAFRFRRKNQC